MSFAFLKRLWKKKEVLRGVKINCLRTFVLDDSTDYDLMLEFEPKKKRDYYLLYTAYINNTYLRSGEAFIDYVDIYESRKAAESNKGVLELDYTNSPNTTLLDNSGDSLSYYRPYVSPGYRLLYVGIALVRLEEENAK
jgi:hypothetical protein